MELLIGLSLVANVAAGGYAVIRHLRHLGSLQFEKEQAEARERAARELHEMLKREVEEQNERQKRLWATNRGLQQLVEELQGDEG